MSISAPRQWTSITLTTDFGEGETISEPKIMELVHEQKLRTALDAGIASLYHYQDFDPARLIDILQNQRVFCSNPATFNDPWDCKPYFDPDVVDEPNTHQRISEYFKSVEKVGPRGDRLRQDPTALKDFIRAYSERLGNIVIPEQLGIYCLGRSPDTALMWSHYAKNHTGVCLEFKAQGSNFALAWQVNYQEEYPVFQVQEMIDQIMMLTTKSDVWAYEEEFRLICPRLPESHAHPLFMRGNFLHIGLDTLQSIIIGCQADRGGIEKLVKTHAPGLRVRRAIRAPNKYRLTIAD